ncbi:MAG TPA: polyprenyl synthetase family protein [Acidimicrobiales bacterium]|nr:polyprenyl synthetase family protein [Acidimicrobiales bacterium]
MNAPELFALAVPDAELVRLEECLRRVVVLGDPFLDEIATHLIDAGGKRLRPALTLAAASLGPGPRDWRGASEDTLLGAVAVELVHLASLYHDDVMDEATRRRNVVSVNARWGNLLAIVAGDFLLARSAEIAASLGIEIAGLLAATLGRLCQGQVADVRAAYRVERTEAEYFSTIADKTGALMSTACRIGALTAGVPRDDVDRLTRFGECLGMVFQIRDDVLDVLATEQELGKPPGQDLAEGIYTLPVQRALDDDKVGPELRSLLGRPLSANEVDEARALVARSPGIAAASHAARHYAVEAIDAARGLGDGPVPSALVQLGVNLLEDLERSTRALAS